MADNTAFRGYRNDQIGVGNEGNTVQVNQPGVYFDPTSEKELEVFHTAAADALVRMGWVECEVERDEKGVITKVTHPTYGGRRPEDSDEVIKLRAELKRAQDQLKTQKPGPKSPANPKEGNK